MQRRKAVKHYKRATLTKKEKHETFLRKNECLTKKGTDHGLTGKIDKVKPLALCHPKTEPVPGKVRYQMHHTADAKGKYKRYPIAHYYLKDLANIYQTSKFLLRNRLKPHSVQIGEPEEGFKYSPRQVELIFNLVPLPSGVYYYKRYKKRE